MNEARTESLLSGIPLGRLFGFPLRLSPSWLVLAALVTITYGQLVARGRPALAGAPAYAIGFGFVVCLVASVLLHELGHAFASRRYGIKVRGITLEMLGGYTEMEHDAPRPRIEFAVSAAGPVVSFGVGLLAVALANVLPDGTLARQLVFELALSNVVVALFNALPGLPLDGGRALQAAVWALSGDQNKGRLVAGWAGRLVGVACAVAGIALYRSDVLTSVGAVFALFIAVTIWYGAGQSIRHARAAARLPELDLDRLARPIFPVPGGIPLAEAEHRAAASGLHDAVLCIVDGEGRLESVVSAIAADAVPPERRTWIAVASLARQLDQAHVLPSGLKGVDLLRAVQADPGGDYLVLNGEDVRGVLRGADLLELLQPAKRTAT
jgi:Zn-dependent protease